MTDQQKTLFENINTQANELLKILQQIPENKAVYIAHTKLQECKMWADYAILQLKPAVQVVAN